jgi:hypothetical protein
MDGGSFIFRDITPSSKGVTVSAPVALSADYQVFWPGALPPSVKLLTLDNSGNISDTYYIDNSTITLSGSNLQAATVLDHGITQVKLAPRTTGITVGAGGVAVSAESGANLDITNSASIVPFTVTITTTGRPVRVEWVEVMDASQPLLTFDGGGAAGQWIIQTVNDNGHNHEWNIDVNNATGTNYRTAGSFNFVDMTVNGVPGTYTYTTNVTASGSGSKHMILNHIQLMAYEL